MTVSYKHAPVGTQGQCVRCGERRSIHFVSSDGKAFCGWCSDDIYELVHAVQDERTA